MIVTAEVRIKEFRKGEVVRMYSKNMYYRIHKSETMASIIAEPVSQDETLNLVEKIRFTAFCSAREAEMFIMNISK